MRASIVLMLMAWSCLIAQAQPAAPVVATVNAPGNSCALPADERAIRRIPEQWKDGYNSGKAADVAALYAEDAYYLTQHFVTGVIRGRPAIQAYVQRGVDAHYHIDSIEILASVCRTEIAYAITRYRSTNGSQSAMGVNLVVLRKFNDAWRIVAHEAAVPDPATAVQSLDPRTP